jgi:hypothetical protein
MGSNENGFHSCVDAGCAVGRADFDLAGGLLMSSGWERNQAAPSLFQPKENRGRYGIENSGTKDYP